MVARLAADPGRRAPTAETCPAGKGAFTPRGALLDDAKRRGATIAAGGDLRPDGVLRPSLVTGARPDMRVSAEEVFGPVVAVTRYDDLGEALALANDTRHGLQAGIFTSSLDTALRAPGGSTSEA
ncbi:aldehyde dehydrogenase family protein [Actinoplanes sp. NPDC051513]|uniref:aldehyde dehydrogenase family protein n=1 Tax=Actinoplanes sp. NPDC051513 TaxID=3363908 RepID=UPI0037AB4FF1